jgi:phosphoglycolate phosphatase-like HAD superfamily hydrolase
VLVSLKQRGNVKIALSTSDLEGNAKSVLDLLGISDLFDIVVCRFLPSIPCQAIH